MRLKEKKCNMVLGLTLKTKKGWGSISRSTRNSFHLDLVIFQFGQSNCWGGLSGEYMGTL